MLFLRCQSIRVFKIGHYGRLGQLDKKPRSHVRNSLVISFAGGSITEEEFLSLYEEYQSEE